MAGKSNGNTNRPRRRRSASTEYAPALDNELHEVVKVSVDRQKNAEERAEEAETTARAARAEIRLIKKSRSQARNARREIGEIVHLFQFRYPDLVPAHEAGTLAKPLALALRFLVTSAAMAKGRNIGHASVAEHVARRLQRLLPLASADDIADAVDFRPYLGTRKWPGVHERSRMLGVTVEECLAIGARHLKPSDLSDREWKNLLARQDYAWLTPEEKAEKNAKAKAKRAAKTAERHKGTAAYIAEQVQALGGKLHRSTAQRWNDLGDDTLRENLIECIVKVKDHAEAERFADIILSKFNDARKNATQPASAVSKKRRKPAATERASAVSATSPPAPTVRGGPEITAPAVVTTPAADATRAASAAKKEMGQTQVLSQIDPVAGGQASSLPPAPLDTVNDRTEREEPVTDQTADIEAGAAGHWAPPPPSSSFEVATAQLQTDLIRSVTDACSSVITAVNASMPAETLRQAIIGAVMPAVVGAAGAGARWKVEEQAALVAAERAARAAEVKIFEERVQPAMQELERHPGLHGGLALVSVLAVAGHATDIIRVFLDRIGPTQVPVTVADANRASTRLFDGMSPEEAAVRLERERMGDTGRVGAAGRLTVIRGGRA